MAVEIRPHATEEEQAALLRLLRELDRPRPRPGEAWRSAALEEGADYAVALRPRNSAGAARA